ncbi:MAG: response regulator transcription factor, partial [Blastocatellia bacterium]|nr:response regulator transcription factor [Blastocatellia bacterium]
QTRYIFRALSKTPVLPQEMGIDIPESFKDPVLPSHPFPPLKQDEIASPSALRRKKETSSKIPKITLEADNKSETQEKELMLALERLGAVAISIEDSNLSIGQTLISFGKRHFKDWPFTFDGENNFKDRVEVNVKWRGSLRKGIFKFGGDIELRHIDETEEKAISEYDWQVMVFPIGVTTNLPANAPITLLAWQPASLTDEEILTVKHLLAARREGELLSDQQSAKVLGLLESEVAEVFERVYLQNGKLVSIDGKESSLAYQSSNFINIILAKLLEKPLAGRYPQHPKFEDLLDPEYVDQVAEWMFDTTKTPTPDQQMYLEQFARPLQLVVFEDDKYKVDVAREFSEDTAVGKLLSLIDKTEDGSISKIAAYRIVRKEPFGLQRPSLLMILAALVAGRRISLVDEFNEPIHTDTGLIQGLELGDFSSIHTTAKSSKAVHVATWKTRPAVQSTAQQFSSKRVLIVDDDPTIHTMLELAAKPLGCKVEKAFDGIEALSILRSSQIDVVISDMRMPNMTGNELFFEMQSNPSLGKIPFIVLTSIDSDEEMAIALESGVEDYWIKPFRFQEVTARLKRLFRSTLPPTGAYAKVELPPQVVEVQQEEIKPIDDVEEEVKTLLYNQVKRSPSPPISLAEAMTDPQPVEVRIEGMTEVAKVNSSKSIPHPPIPMTPKSFESTEQVEVEETNKSTGSRTDELAIPSVPAELTKQIEFEVADEEKKSNELESNTESQEGKIIFSIMLSNPESSTIDIMLLYNQFWDSCRRGNKSSTIPEYEEFKEMIISKARKLKKQFNCNDLVFSVKIENGITHVDCQVTRQDEYLKKQPKFRLI